MPAPVIPSEILALLPSTDKEACEAFTDALVALNQRYYQLWNWLLDQSGNPSAAFLQLQRIPGTLIISGFTMNEATDYVLFCDGRAVSRTTYSALFAKIGTTFGAGDGSTTFNIPNCVDRFLVGAGGLYSIGATGGEASHSLTATEMPPHRHHILANDTTSGAAVPTASNQMASIGGGAANENYNAQGTSTDATIARTSQIGGTAGSVVAHENRPPYMGFKCYISY